VRTDICENYNTLLSKRSLRKSTEQMKSGEEGGGRDGGTASLCFRSWSSKLEEEFFLGEKIEGRVRQDMQNYNTLLSNEA
jgi:hypothetical protein